MSNDQDRPDEKESNIIRFPVERVKSKRKLKKLAGKAGDNKKATLFLSLLSVLVMSAFLLKNLGQQVGRDVASSDNRDRQLEQELAQKLKGSDYRSPASYGRRPSSEDHMRKELPGFKFEHEDGLFMGAIKSTSRDPQNLGALSVINKVFKNDIADGNLDVFLMKYRDYIYPTFESVKPYADPDEHSLSAVNYQLFKANKPTGYIVRFDIEPSDEVNSIKVQAIRKP